MNFKIIFFNIIIICFITTINAEQVRTKSFKYYKDIDLKEFNKGSTYGIIILDDDIYKYSYGNDLRLVLKNKAIPYFLSEQYLNQKRENVTPKVIFNKLEEEKRVYILQFPEVPKGSEYIELYANVLHTGNYEIDIKLSQSKDLKSWDEINNQSIFKYSDKNNNIININLKETLYLRLETNNKYEMYFPNAVYIPKRYEEYIENISIDQLEISKNKDRVSTVYYFENEKHKKINQLILKFKEHRYERKFEIQTKYKKRFNYFMSDTIKQNEKGNQIIYFKKTIQDPFKLFIRDGDNEPLNLEKFTIVGPKEVLIFNIPEEINDNENLQLYYGNRYIKSPVYDIKYTFDKNQNYIYLNMGKHIINQNFSYSIIEPPISLWIIRIIFLCGLIGLIWPTYIIIKKFSEDVSNSLNKKSL